MWPLLKRDGLAVQYIATLVLWNRLIGYNPLRLQENSMVRLLSIVSLNCFLSRYFQKAQLWLYHKGYLYCVHNPSCPRTRLSPSTSLPRLIPRLECPYKHACFCPSLVMEYQMLHRNWMGIGGSSGLVVTLPCQI